MESLKNWKMEIFRSFLAVVSRFPQTLLWHVLLFFFLFNITFYSLYFFEIYFLPFLLKSLMQDIC